MGEILAIITVLVVLIGIAYLLPSSHRRHECHMPEDDQVSPEGVARRVAICYTSPIGT